MWDAIERNQRRSWILISIMGGVLVLLGSLIGLAIFPEAGGVIGASIALVLWLGLLIVALSQGERAILMAAGARQLIKQDAPQLWNVVEEMTIASGLGQMPRIYLVEDEAPNAFAVGQKQKTAIVAVTSGLLARLNRDELQGVIAHEIAHIKNLDVRFMTIASVMVGSIVLLAQFYLRYVMFGGGRRRTPSKGSAAQGWFMVLAIVAAILAPIAARLLYLACSRRREYLADASAARFTRFPDGLASALEKIALRQVQHEEANRALAPLYIVNPLEAAHSVPGLFSTHPPTGERIKILRSMGGRAGYVDYEGAYRQVHGQKSRCLGIRTLSAADARSVLAREPAVEPDTKEHAVERVQEVMDLLGRMANLLLLTCTCGVKIRVPEEFKKNAIACPRCGKTHSVTEAKKKQEAAKEEPPGEEAKPSEAPTPQRYQRQGKGWESFECACGRVLQLAPSFSLPAMRCPSCKKSIEIVEAQEKVSDTVA